MLFLPEGGKRIAALYRLVMLVCGYLLVRYGSPSSKVPTVKSLWIRNLKQHWLAAEVDPTNTMQVDISVVSAIYSLARQYQ